MSYQKNVGAVRRFARLMKFANWLQALPNRLTPPPFRLVQISSQFWQSRALYVAASLDISGALGDEQLAAEEIARRVGAHPDATWRLLRMLAAMGVFEETAPRVFRNNKLSNPLRADQPNNVRAMILMHNSDVMSRPWFEQLEAGVRQNQAPFKLTHGAELFTWMDEHAGFDALFAQAMDSVEALSGDSFASDFDWQRFDRIIDLGGSKGAKALAILKRHPGPSALVVDRAQVIAGAEHYWVGREDPALLARMQFQSGDVLAAVPQAAGGRDIYLMSALLHGFDDATCVRILGNVAAACAGSGARVAILELVLPEMGADLAAASFDMQMFMGTSGRERTLDEWRRLVGQGGGEREEVVGLQSFGNILVLREAQQQ